MLDRHLTRALSDAAATNPVVTVTGPRQSGKTTLVCELFRDHLYLSLEAPDLRAWALEDPRGFLAQGECLILDEIQRAPELLSCIQVLIDQNDRPGRFILTGSQDLVRMESLPQTLAGRAALLRLYPFSLAELQGRRRRDPGSLDRIAGKEAKLPRWPPQKRRWETLIEGFYPRIHDEGVPAREWLADYFRTYVERDLREVMQISDLRAFESFVRLAAARTSQELNLVALGDDVGVTQQTARRWLNALEIGFLRQLREHIGIKAVVLQVEQVDLRLKRVQAEVQLALTCFVG
jgi:predicted AAA+ superfamily ATPase